MHLLAITTAGDEHVGAMEWALNRIGGRVSWFCASDFPALSTHTISIGSQVPRSHSAKAPGASRNGPYDAVWMRRVPLPNVPTGLHAADTEICAKASERFTNALLQVVAPEAFWVNPLEAAVMNRDSKLRQLMLAQECGLKVPNTIASNDPHQIRDFYFRQNGRVIAKPLSQQSWVNRDMGRYYSFLTTRILESSLSNDEVLQASPLIFQECIEKAYELRITYIGPTCFVARLNSQENPETSTDWRAPGREVPMEVTGISHDIDAGCRQLMNKLGLRYGAIDAIVTKEGEVVFLEVNSAGQYLWVEDKLPEIPLLDATLEYFLSLDPGHKYSWRSPEVRLSDYLRSSYFSSFHRQSGEHLADGRLHISAMER